MKTPTFLTLLALSLLPGGCGDNDNPAGSNSPQARAATGMADEHGHPTAEEHGHEEEAGIVVLTPEQMQTAGIGVTRLEPRPVITSLSAPGEVMLNAYHMVRITPRIAAQVVARHVKLGDVVEAGQPLVTLSSVEMAEAQGELRVANQEWQRVRKLGRKVVSERRYTEARVAAEQAIARVQAYGMTDPQIQDLLAGNKGVTANGTFQLLAPRAGRVIHDTFIVGQRVEPGEELLTIADESVMWVEARIKPNDAARIEIGSPAEVRFNDTRLPARVSQIHHTLDETTRTLAVRLEVDNPQDILHPGMFVTARIRTRETEPALVVPEAAVLRSPDGDWQVFVEQDEPGEFRAMEVRVRQIIDGQAVIEGIAAGTTVVTRGAFFVQSELAKSDFEVHNH